LILRVLSRMLTVLVPLFVLLLAVGAGASIAQVGFQINAEKLEFKFDRLNPATGWQKLFSVSALVRGGLTILKVLTKDIAELDRVYRMLSVLGLGALLVAASYLYQKMTTGRGPDQSTT
jgi:flagellar biosynthesis protein FlhB